MRKHINSIALSLAFLALMLTTGVAMGWSDFMLRYSKAGTVNGQYEILQAATEDSLPTYGDILDVRFDEEVNNLIIEYVGGESDTFHLDPTSLEPEVFDINLLGRSAYLRFFSPALYESYGQTSQGIIILTYIDPSKMRSDPGNDVASKFSPAKQPTTVDLSFAMIHNYFEEHNMVGAGLPICAANTADEILQGVASSTCYIVCQGKAEVMAQFLPTDTRFVPMWSRREDLENGYIFLWSELHSTIEVFSNNEWYVADPTYGFAYVKNTIGQRLTAQELIDALEGQEVGDLTFGLVHNGLIHDVPGELFVEANSTLAGIYYTPDKRLEYRVVNDEQGTP